MLFRKRIFFHSANWRNWPGTDNSSQLVHLMNEQYVGSKVNPHCGSTFRFHGALSSSRSISAQSLSASPQFTAAA